MKKIKNTLLSLCISFCLMPALAVDGVDDHMPLDQTRSRLAIVDETVLFHIAPELTDVDLTNFSQVCRWSRQFVSDTRLEKQFLEPMASQLRGEIVEFDTALESVIAALTTTTWIHSPTASRPDLYNAMGEEISTQLRASLVNADPFIKSFVRLVGSDPIALRYATSYRCFLLDSKYRKKSLKAQVAGAVRYIYALSRLRYLSPHDNERQVHLHIGRYDDLRTLPILAVETLLQDETVRGLISRRTVRFEDFAHGLKNRDIQGPKGVSQLIELIHFNARLRCLDLQTLLYCGISRSKLEEFSTVEFLPPYANSRESIVRSFVEFNYTKAEVEELQAALEDLFANVKENQVRFSYSSSMTKLKTEILVSFMNAGFRAPLLRAIANSDVARNHIASQTSAYDIEKYLNGIVIMGSSPEDLEEYFNYQSETGNCIVPSIRLEVDKVVKCLKKNGASISEICDFVTFFHQLWAHPGCTLGEDKKRTPVLLDLIEMGVSLDTMKRMFQLPDPSAGFDILSFDGNLDRLNKQKFELLAESLRRNLEICKKYSAAAQLLLKQIFREDLAQNGLKRPTLSHVPRMDIIHERVVRQGDTYTEEDRFKILEMAGEIFRYPTEGVQEKKKAKHEAYIDIKGLISDNKSVEEIIERSKQTLYSND